MHTNQKSAYQTITEYNHNENLEIGNKQHDS